MPNADLKNLEDELYREGLVRFRAMREAHPEDTFYCFAFFTNDEFNYVSVTASTYEGLDRIAQEYKKDPRYNAKSIDDLKLALKWSPADSPLHDEADSVLTDLDPAMQAVADELQNRFDLDDDSKSLDEYRTQIETCFANALTRIDAEGAFGRGDERKKVVVNLLMGDQSDEARIAFAERVNPPESVAMLKRDLEAARA